MLTIAIQAGGQSQRFGQDKALVQLTDKTLIEHVIERVRPIANELIITTNNPKAYRFLDLPLFTDILPDRGALGGLFTALTVAQHPVVGVVACDMPFVCSELLAVERDMLIEGTFDVVIPKTEHGTEPFHAIYRSQTCLPAIRQAIEAGKKRVDAWFSQAKILYLPLAEIVKHDPFLLTFWNINNPDDLVKARVIIQSDRFTI